jgi:nitric oxide dioxygenase
MDARTIDLLAMSFARISAHKHDAATLFYARLFTTAPQLRPLFKADLEEQKQKLILSLAQIIDFYRLGADAERHLGRLGRSQGDSGVQKSHFAAVGDALIFMLAQILGDDFTPEIRSAWIAAYSDVSEHMMGALETAPVSVPPLTAVGRW